MQPRISIITVVYNGRETLPQTIRSVTSQDYDNIEYIVIDGGSTDGTISLLEESNNAITYWISEHDKGIYDAMNKGIKRATGDWLLFLNSGDAFAGSDVVTKFVNASIDEEADLIYGDVFIISQHGERSLRILRNTLPFLMRNMICHQSIFYSNKLFKSIGVFDTHYRLIADFEHLMRARFNGYAIKKVELVISNYSLDGISAQHKNLKKIWRERIAIFKKATYMPLFPRFIFLLYATAAFIYRKMY
jgi:glycosyltransferase involved in cell wall biosynthesis